jgi:hypothetical protein
MKRSRLPVTVGMILVTGFALAKSGAFGGSSAPAALKPLSAAGRSPENQAIFGADGWHFRHSRPTHWRDSLLRP